MIVSQVTHLQSENEPSHVLAANLEEDDVVRQQRTSNQLQEARVEVQDGDEEDERDDQTVKMLDGRRRQIGEDCGEWESGE